MMSITLLLPFSLSCWLQLREWKTLREGDLTVLHHMMCFTLFQINFNDYLVSLQLARACDTELGPSSADTEVGSGR